MNYMPKHLAVLYSTIVKHILLKQGESASDDIKQITMQYAKHRAQRMKKRAVFDNQKLGALEYFAYSELAIPPQTVESTIDFVGENALQIVKKCPWYDAWHELGHLEYGKFHCEVFDETLASSFSEKVNLSVPLTITDVNDHCKFIFKNTNFTDEQLQNYKELKAKIGSKAIKPFEYHMAHLYFVLSREIKAKYGTIGDEILKDAMLEYESYFGESAVKDIMDMQDIDFTSIDDYMNTD